MIQGLIHVGIGSMDFEKMLTFYRDVIGLKVDNIRGHFMGGKVAFLSASTGEVIELTQYPHPRPPRPEARERGNAGINHFGFKVDDFEVEYSRLRGLGVEFEDELRPAVPGQNRVCHFWDPEGNRVHITEVAK